MEEFNFSSFLNENKKVLIIIGIVIVVLIAIAIAMNLKNIGEDQEEVGYVGSTYVDPLPQANIESEPVLFDYEQGSLGYHSDIKFEDKFMNYCYVIASETSKLDESSGDIYICVYGGTGVLPTIGSDYKGYHLDGDQWKIVSGRISSWPEELSEVEGGYKFCALCNLTMYNLDTTYPEFTLDENVGSSVWCDIDFRSINYGDSKFTTNYLNEKGYPTDWVRKFNDKFHDGDQYIKNPIYVNFSDEFWDKYNYRQVIRLQNQNGDIEKYMATMVDTFSEVSEDEDGHYDISKRTINSEQLEQMKNTLGLVEVND